MSASVSSTITVSGAADSASAIDLAQPVPHTAGADIAVALDAVALDAVAYELRVLWSSALERGDFNEITRLVEASHPVHRAVIALTTDRFIATQSSPSAPG